MTTTALKIFFCHFMCSVRALIFENIHFVSEIYFISLKPRPRSNFKCFPYRIWTSDRKGSYLVKQILSLLCKLVTLILD